MKNTIGIIGGGFSGLSVLAHLIALYHSRPLHIYLFEKSPAFAKGVAFGTDEANHLLNVKANRMGAFSNKPEDFYVWLKARESLWRPFFKDLKISPDAYCPRKLYGLYLKDVFEQSLETARKKGIIVEIIHENIERIQLLEDRLLLEDKFLVDFCILATGASSFKKLKFETKELIESRAYCRNIWTDTPWAQIAKSADIVIVGSGLTAVDAIVSLADAKYKGKITLISRSGEFPQVHEEYSHPFHLKDLPDKITCLELFKYLRREKARLNENAGLKENKGWRALIDSIRPFTERLWSQFDTKNKKQFLRHLFSLWNRHRHRMAPESWHSIQELKKEKRLHLIKGTIQSVEKNTSGKFTVSCNDLKLEADHILNCTGPDYSPNSPLLKKMLGQGIILPDSLGLGLKTSAKECLAGANPDANSGNLFALGSLLFGEKFETTAVPEIREQAASIAHAIISKFIKS